MAYDENNIFAKILRGEMPCVEIAQDRTYPRLHGHHAASARACAGDPEISGGKSS